jgi:hypothetical protein
MPNEKLRTISQYEHLNVGLIHSVQSRHQAFCNSENAKIKWLELVGGMRSNGKWEDIVLHAQIEEEIAIVGAASIKNQHGVAGIVRSVPRLLDLGMKIWTTVRFRRERFTF